MNKLQALQNLDRPLRRAVYRQWKRKVQRGQKAQNEVLEGEGKEFRMGRNSLPRSTGARPGGDKTQRNAELEWGLFRELTLNEWP